MTGEPGSELVARRLGLTECVIRQLQARGYLDRLDLDESDLQERLYCTYLRIVRRTIVSMDD